MVSAGQIRINLHVSVEMAMRASNVKRVSINPTPEFQNQIIPGIGGSWNVSDG